MKNVKKINLELSNEEYSMLESMILAKVNQKIKEKNAAKASGDEFDIEMAEASLQNLLDLSVKLLS